METNENNGSGRASYTKDERRELIKEYHTSESTRAAFCREWNINPKTLARWLRAERQEDEVSFCEVELLPDPPVTDELKICLANGIEVLVKVESTEALGRVFRSGFGIICRMVFSRGNFDQLLAENANLKSEVGLLQEKVQCLMKKLFGRSSEKLSPDQLMLELEELREVLEALPTMNQTEASSWTPARWKSNNEVESD